MYRPSIVAIKAEVSPRVRRLCRMRAAELDLSISQYIAALIIADTEHFGSIAETEGNEDDDGGNAAA